MSFKLLIVFTTFCILPYVNSCGSITHLLISERGKEYFDGNRKNIDYQQLLYRHNDAFQAGSIFPDAFFSSQCFGGNYSQISEDSHWEPFLDAYLNYLSTNFQQPWNSTAEKLVAFLFGIISHQTSDTFWCSLGVNEGLASAFAAVDFHGNISAAKEAAALGGDVISLFDLDALSLIDPQNKWFVPTKDLYNIYKDLYGSVKIEEDVIDICSTLHVLESIAEFYSYTELYHEVAKTSPFLINNMADYFLGGIDDIIVWIQRSWASVNIQDHGIRTRSLPYDPIHMNCDSPTKDLQNRHKLRNGLDVLTIDALHVQRVPDGVIIQLKNKTENDVKSISNKDVLKEKQDNIVASSGVYIVNSSFAKFGWVMATGDMDNDGYTDLIIGAPGYSEIGSQQEGRVYIVYGDDSENGGFGEGLINLDSVNCSLQITTLKGDSEKQSRFGSGIAVLDINLDGILDLAIGSPAYWIEGALLEYKGLVSIYFGKKNSRVYGSADVTITCQKKHCNLGYNLESGDVDGDGHDDLLMGLPFFSSRYTQDGMVAALIANKTISVGERIPLENIGWKLTPEKPQPYGWFGYKTTSKAKVLMVTSPNVRKCASSNCSYSSGDLQQTGRADIFNFGKIYNLRNSSITGTKEHEFAGYSLDFGFLYGGDDLFLAVGFPGMDVRGTYQSSPVNLTRAGVVIIYNITLHTPYEVARFSGNRQYGGFGTLVKVQDLNADGIQDLLIGEPYRNKNTKGNPYEADGHVYIFYGGYSFPKGNATYSSKCKLTTPCPDEVADLVLGNDPFVSGNNGYEAEALYNPKSQVVLFTSDIRTYGSYKQFHRSGAVHHYFMNRL